MPILRIAGAFAALASIGASQPALTSTVPASAIVKVQCLVGSGTAFRIGPQETLSVNHVTSLAGCFIEGKRINVSYHGGDFSILTESEASDKWLEIDCNGFVKGRKYLAKGYARGLDRITTVELEGTDTMMGPFSVLRGMFTVIPGQSGGPLIDKETGKVVGTINIYNFQAGLSGSIALRDTPICPHS